MKRFLLLPALLAMIQLQAQQIEEYRYWINDDPTALSVSGIGPAQQVVLNAALALPVLTKDFNSITIQFKDTNDVYSVPVSSIFTRNTGNVVGYEYWIDDDIAGRVSGTLTAGTNVVFASNIALCLTAGSHVFAIRFQGASGTWSVPVTRQFTSTTSVDTDGDGTCDAIDGCPNDPNKIAPGICGCGAPDTDGDSDGTADCNDGCPTDPNKIAPGICGCGVPDTDSDGDGAADCNDACPQLPNLVNGDPCDDGNANTMNDVVSNCICAGTLIGNDCEGVPGGPAQPGTSCDDGDPCTINDVYQVNCTCAGTFQDTDGDGVCDANDTCDNNTDGDPCDDGDACTINDVLDNCVCSGTYQDTDGDGICDASDSCPTLFGQVGDLCDDGNANTVNDMIGANCVCAGTNGGNTCQPTQLTTTADPVITCGLTGVQLNGTTTLWAVEVPGANRYQFSFSNITGQPAYSRNIASATRSLPLYTWATTPLKKGRTYQVRVRASFDNGATWCPYDAMCTVSISNNALSMLRDVEAVEVSEGAMGIFDLFPNPTSDGSAEVRYTNADLEDGSRINMDVLDALGRVVVSEQGAMADGKWNARLRLPADRSTGLYIVRLNAGDEMTYRPLIVR